MGKYLGDGLKNMQKDFPEIGDVRQAGLHIGVEFVYDLVSKEPMLKEGNAIRQKAIELGLILGIAGTRSNVLKVKPPLIVNQSECDEILEKFEKSVKALLRA